MNMSDLIDLLKMSAIATVVVFISEFISWHLSGRFIGNGFWHAVVLGFSVVFVLSFVNRFLAWRLKTKTEKARKDKGLV